MGYRDASYHRGLPPERGRRTLVTTGNDSVIAQIVSQLRKLVDVVQVEDLTRGDHFERELLLLKLKVSALRLEAVTGLVTEASGRILSGALANFVIELTSSEALVSRFLAEMAKHAEVLEVVRSGALGIRVSTATATQVSAA